MQSSMSEQKTPSARGNGDEHGLLERALSTWERGGGAGPAHLPFAAALSPFVESAWRPVEERRAAALEPFVVWEGVAPALKAQLFERLHGLSARVLVLELNVARLEGRLRGATPEERFRDYRDRVLARPDAWRALFSEYVVLERLFSRALASWASATDELFARLEHDRDVLASLTGSHDSLLLHVRPDLSDPHRGGRAVAILTFVSPAGAGPARVVYKPKPLEADLRFQALLAWANAGAERGELRLASGEFPRFALTRVVPCGEYGWAAYLAHEPCRSHDEATRFFQRQGALLGLLHVLCATDIHQENVIACGEHPMLVDLETLFHHGDPWPVEDGARGLAARLLADSVLSVGLLPQRVWGGDGEGGVDISGLGGGGEQRAPFASPLWEGSGTDVMRQVTRRLPLAGSQNLPLLDGEPLKVADHEHEVLEGLDAMLRFLEVRREELLAPGGPIAAFGRARVRHVLRDTSWYARILRDATHPDALRDGAAHEDVLDLLAAIDGDRPGFEAVRAMEKGELLNGDVPSFTTTPDDRDLEGGAGVARGFFAESSLERVRGRLGALDARGRALQVRLARGALASASAPAKAEPLRGGIGAGFQAGGARPLPLEPQLVDAAALLGASLVDTAIERGSEATWIGLSCAGRERLAFDVVGSCLYDGEAGIALFLGRLGDVTREETFTRVAALAARGVAARITQDPAGWGGFTGLPSRLYALDQLARLWGDASLAAAVRVGFRRLAERDADDLMRDVLDGKAGAVLALLSLRSVDGARLLAARYGRELLCAAETRAHGRAWRSTAASRPLLGFAHGAGGVACALAVLAAGLRDQASADAARLLDAARDGLAYERSHYDAACANWPDLRGLAEDEPARGARCLLGWCSGAPGVVLSRLVARDALMDAAVDLEIEAGVETILAAPLLSNHSLCHGELGNLTIAAAAARVLDREDWMARLRTRAAAVLHDLEASGPRCGTRAPRELPGLLNGIAGVGYGLLELAFPGRVPSVLALAAA